MAALEIGLPSALFFPVAGTFASYLRRPAVLDYRRILVAERERPLAGISLPHAGYSTPEESAHPALSRHALWPVPHLERSNARAERVS
jgi:hypothetical protein